MLFLTRISLLWAFPLSSKFAGIGGDYREVEGVITTPENM